MHIYIDSREKPKAITEILKTFDEKGIKYMTNKLYVGDYQRLDNPMVIVDRKQNLNELYSNFTSQHDRFRNELIRAKEAGIRLVILIEDKKVSSIDEVVIWENPRRKKRVNVDGKWKTITTKARNGDWMYKVMNTMMKKYGVEFEFCNKKETGNRIIEILSEEQWQEKE